jgi:hypothetical protein
MSPGEPWPPNVGELLPRAAEVFGVHDKLATYSLDRAHKDGGPKALGFLLILGITLQDIDYLEAQIIAGVLNTPINAIRDNPPWGVNCVVVVPVHGLREKSDRVVNVRTAWELAEPGEKPRLVSAYIDN